MGKRTCSVDGCGFEYLALGYCSRHYQLWRRNGVPDWEPGLPCAFCGAEFDRHHPQSRYCSPDCRKASAREKRALIHRRYQLRYKYGMTMADYDDLLAAQSGRCAICGTNEPGGKGEFHVDHDHDSGGVRGLLCHYCNVGIGTLGDDPARLRAAAEYLERAKATADA